MRIKKEELKTMFELIVKKYLLEFLNNFDEEDEELDLSCIHQVGEQNGGVYDFADAYLDFDNIRYCVDNKIKSEKLMEYFHYSVDNYTNTEYPTRNFINWLKLQKEEKTNV